MHNPAVNGVGCSEKRTGVSETLSYIPVQSVKATSEPIGELYLRSIEGTYSSRTGKCFARGILRCWLPNYRLEASCFSFTKYDREPSTAALQTQFWSCSIWLSRLSLVSSTGYSTCSKLNCIRTRDTYPDLSGGYVIMIRHVQ